MRQGSTPSADERTRTSTGLPPRRPERRAYTNFATSAVEGGSVAIGSLRDLRVDRRHTARGPVRRAPAFGRCRDQPLARPRPRLPRAVHGRARRDDHERRAAVDPARPRVQRRPTCSGSSTPTRSCSAASCCSAAARATCSAASGSSSRASRSSRSRRCSTGSRRRARCSSPPAALQGLGAALVSPAALSIITTTFEEGARPHEGARRLERDRRRRRRVRPAARRHPHRAAVVGVDLLRQRADRHRRRRLLGAALRARVARRRTRPDSIDLAGAVTVTAGLDRARLRDRQGRGLRLGLGADARPGGVAVALLARSSSSSGARRRR